MVIWDLNPHCFMVYFIGSPISVPGLREVSHAGRGRQGAKAFVIRMCGVKRHPKLEDMYTIYIYI